MIKLLFFGSIADKMGKRSMNLSAGKSLMEIIQEVGCVDFKPLLVAVNQEQIRDMNYVVKSGDEVAIMPPFSGG